MKIFFLLLFNLIFIMPLYSMKPSRVRRWDLEGTTLMQCVEQTEDLYIDTCIQKKGEDQNAVYTGYKLIFQTGSSGRELKLVGKNAEDAWFEMEKKSNK